MSESSDPDPYYQAIEEAFNRRRGAPLLLAPRDWALIGEWKRLGVPIPIVLQGIDNVFDAYQRRPPTARRINSLSYCRQEVLGLHELYLGLHGVEAGRPEPAPEGGAARQPPEAVTRYLKRLRKRLKEAATWCSEQGLDDLVGPIAEASGEVKAIQRGLADSPFDPQALEAGLGRLDAALVERARQVIPEADRRALEAEVETKVAAPGGRMTPAALDATRRATITRLLRLRCGLPRLSLFD
ncbi:MAG TPA: hypothetical protein VFB49_12935 [Patescibacteria group bacterium]|nr:hypothetical protein [Patescibacteria group bacterium]